MKLRKLNEAFNFDDLLVVKMPNSNEEEEYYIYKSLDIALTKISELPVLTRNITHIPLRLVNEEVYLICCICINTANYAEQKLELKSKFAGDGFEDGVTFEEMLGGKDSIGKLDAKYLWITGKVTDDPAYKKIKLIYDGIYDFAYVKYPIEYSLSFRTFRLRNQTYNQKTKHEIQTIIDNYIDSKRMKELQDMRDDHRLQWFWEGN